MAATYTVSEFHNDANETGAAADAEWNEIMHCLREVYSPYNVTVTDVRPTGGVLYNEGILAGIPDEVGLGTAGVGGVAPAVGGGCTPHTNVLSFSFANASFYHGPDRVLTLCYVVAQETAHAYGLDHEYSFIDGTSSCRSPMTYRNDCGGQRFFRNQPANCGEVANRPCKCGGLQDSHKRLLAALGPGTPITRPPTSTILVPANGATVTNGTSVQATAGAQRGIARTELWLNGHNWAQAKGAPWGQNGQPDPSTYQMSFPATVPDGVIDIVVKAYDDIEVETESPTVTVTKGAPCASAATCLEGQKCEAGKCFWDPPTGMLGQSCSYNEFCTSGMCQDTSDGQFCTQECIVGSEGACPASFDCVATSDTGGVCLPAGSGSSGCCSAGRESSSTIFARLALGMFVFGFVVRRRRSRR
jgi:MYXO-CTERM domain-containing protein